MSLSWRKPVSVGLFPGQCWLQHGRAPSPSLALDDAADPAALLLVLDAMLDKHAAVLAKGSAVTLQVSDGVGAVALLPWQDELTSPDELHGYGRACFDKQGMAIDDGWVMRAEFRHHRAMGLAYALPRRWIEELDTMLRARGLRLQRVLPVTALAFARQNHRPRDGRSVVLLREAKRVTALVYDRMGLCGLDVEPVLSTGEVAGTRLLRRIGANGAALHTVWDWSPDGVTDASAPAYIAECLPDAVRHALDRDVWSY